WLMQFQQETRDGEIEVNDAWIEQEARIPWQVYRSRYPWTEREESFSEKSLKEWRRWIGTRIPRVGCHGDFWSGNFFLNGPTLSVFDWTFSKRGALPFDDLFLFISSLVVDFPGRNEEGDETGSFEKIFFDPHWLRRKIQETLALFFSELKLPPPLLSQLFPLFLLKMAIRKEGEYQIHSRRNPVWRERLLSYIRNEERFIHL
ncbi:MAG TPA: phosphotransferase, partial [Candidatus Manganitrophaceae bacterium]|nr:phosphotransferase [Candidatus Manganitrophaceae bacterium]